MSSNSKKKDKNIDISQIKQDIINIEDLATRISRLAQEIVKKEKVISPQIIELAKLASSLLGKSEELRKILLEV